MRRSVAAGDSARSATEPAMTATTPASRPPETAVLGGGCFWCLDAVFDELAGVQSVESGYAGGRNAEPDLRRRLQRPHRARRGRARRRSIPSVLSFRDLLTRVLHDPRPDDAGPPGQRRRHAVPLGDLLPDAGAARDRGGGASPSSRRQKLWKDPIVTEIADAAPFYAAERYHQEYFARNPGQPYCTVVVAPKVAKFRKQFAERLKRKRVRRRRR